MSFRRADSRHYWERGATLKDAIETLEVFGNVTSGIHNDRINWLFSVLLSVEKSKAQAIIAQPADQAHGKGFVY